jgi:alpha-glucosidase
VVEQLDAHRAVGAVPAWVLGNHDATRVATRRGTGASLALHLFLLAMPGAFYLYAGDELGLPTAPVPRTAWQDPQALRTDGRLPSRDGARIPLPWTDDPPGHGFTTGRPWLPTPTGWGSLARDRQEADPASSWGILHRSLAARRELWSRADDTVRWLRSPPGTLVVMRGDVVVVLNASVRSRPLSRLLPRGSEWTVAAASGPLGHEGADSVRAQDVVLPPATTVWLSVRDRS